MSVSEEHRHHQHRDPVCRLRSRSHIRRAGDQVAAVADLLSECGKGPDDKKPAQRHHRMASNFVKAARRHCRRPEVAPSGFNEITGHAMVALRWLFIVWTFAAFGEEIGYRGYLVTRAADVGARSKAAYWVAVLMVSVLFGYGHYYKGPSGVVDSGMAGLAG